MSDQSPDPVRSVSPSSRRKPQKFRSSRRRLVRCAVVLAVNALFCFFTRGHIFDSSEEVDFYGWLFLFLSLGLYVGLAQGNRFCRWLTITHSFATAAAVIVALLGMGLQPRSEAVAVSFYLCLGLAVVVSLMVSCYLLLSEGIAREMHRLNP